MRKRGRRVLRKTAVWRTTAAAVLTTAGCVAAWIGLAVQTGRTPDTEQPEPAGMTTAAQAVYRVLGVWQGRLAVFRPEEETPERVYEVWVSSLPDAERERLRAGIAVSDRRELLALLEDYTG